MKMSYYISAFSFLLLALFSACERDADIDLPETAPKLVVVSFITPQDTLLMVMVTRSKPIFQSYEVNTTSAVADASVIISNGANSMQLQYDPVLEYYTGSSAAFPIAAGTTYSLTVTTPQGESANAMTTVPPHNGIANYSVVLTDSLVADMWYSQLYTKFDYTFTDYAGENNQYRFFSSVISRDTLTNDTISERYINSLFTDENSDGQTIEQKLHGQWFGSEPNAVVIGYDCWLFNVNMDYYNFHNSLYNAGGDDPFSEPSLIYTNVNGGLGVFAAANGSRIRIYR